MNLTAQDIKDILRNHYNNTELHQAKKHELTPKPFSEWVLEWLQEEY